MKAPLSFDILKRSKNSLARAGVIHTPHGDIETPAFLTVGTKATVKSLKPEDLRTYVKNQAVLANTYHLYLQPGAELIKEAGGIHAFMNWDGPIMTDSGGFQVFSLGAAFGKGVTKFAKSDIATSDRAGLNVYSRELAREHGKLCIIDEEGVTFTSHHDGSMHRFTAERSIEIQHNIGADIIVAFDECTSPTAPKEYQIEAMERTHRWAKRSLMMHKQLITEEMKATSLKRQARTPSFDPHEMRTDETGTDQKKEWGQGIYGVVQGGRHLDLRKQSAEALGAMDFDGFGIGGSFTKDDLGEYISVVNEHLPEEKPRHLLGIGEPEDIVDAVHAGCDTFDCVAPTRIARTGTIYECIDGVHTRTNLRKNAYIRDFSKPDASCDCYVCEHYTKAYLAHLFRSNEMLGAHLASLHNLYYIVEFTRRLREEILEKNRPPRTARRSTGHNSA